MKYTIYVYKKFFVSVLDSIAVKAKCNFVVYKF